MPERRAPPSTGGPGPARPGRLRRARPEDLDAIVALERAAFQPWRQSSRDSLRRSLQSPRQSVWVVEDDRSAATGRGVGAASPDERPPAIAASLVLWHHPRSLRVYGVAVRPDMQGHGLGRRLMQHAELLARDEGKDRIILEADVSDRQLVAWYDGQGYRRGARLPGFYGIGRDAWRLEKRL